MKTRPFTLTTLLCLITILGYSQPNANTTGSPEDAQEKIASSITAAELSEHLTILASDEFEGRETGTEGNKKAAAYIADQFKEFGIKPCVDNKSYFQSVAFSKLKWKDIELSVNDNKYKHLWDYMSFPSFNADLKELKTEEVVFLGYGIDDPNYSDYNGTSVAGKVILIYNGEPTNLTGKSLITGSEEMSDWTLDWTKKFEIAKEKGVKAILILHEDMKAHLNKNRRFFMNPRMSIGEPEDGTNYANSVYISSAIAKDILGKKFKKVVKIRNKIKKGKQSKQVKLKPNLVLSMERDANVLRGDNVLGFIPGSDLILKEEIVVISAHYDHLGKRGDDVYNGANDNGSGTSTVLEIAEAFSTAKQMGLGAKRSILCLLVTGEEKGLLGSEYYSKNPVFPLENTIADINIDMVGRSDKLHVDNPYYIYVIGSNMMSTELHNINEEMNEIYTQIELDYKYNAKDDPNRYYYRSDHYNFAKNGVPAIFYFNGTHDDYHRTSDTVDKINFDAMEKVGRLAFHTAWELANRKNRIVNDVEQE